MAPKVQTRIAENLHPVEFSHLGKPLNQQRKEALYLVEQGALIRRKQGRDIELLGAGDFFGEDQSVFSEDTNTELIIVEPVKGYRLDTKYINDIPIIRWKLLETHQKRKRILKY